MICEKCGHREATYKYTEIFNGRVTERHLCRECAGMLDLNGHRNPAAALFDGGYQLSRLLSGLLGLESTETGQERDSKSGQITCPTCHTTYDEFVRESRFGCPDCYEMFAILMGDHIKTIQGSDTHVGKVQMRSKSEVKADHEDKAGEKDNNEKLELLNSRLQEALAEEAYETAAKYRDEIRALKERMAADE